MKYVVIFLIVWYIGLEIFVQREERKAVEDKRKKEEEIERYRKQYQEHLKKINRW